MRHPFLLDAGIELAAVREQEEVEALAFGMAAQILPHRPERGADAARILMIDRHQHGDAGVVSQVPRAVPGMIGVAIRPAQRGEEAEPHADEIGHAEIAEAEIGQLERYDHPDRVTVHHQEVPGRGRGAADQAEGQEPAPEHAACRLAPPVRLYQRISQRHDAPAGPADGPVPAHRSGAASGPPASRPPPARCRW